MRFVPPVLCDHDIFCMLQISKIEHLWSFIKKPLKEKLPENEDKQFIKETQLYLLSPVRIRQIRVRSGIFTFSF